VLSDSMGRLLLSASGLPGSLLYKRGGSSRTENGDGGCVGYVTKTDRGLDLPEPGGGIPATEPD
jgi:hypothetical protein